MGYIAPQYRAGTFTCPVCRQTAKHKWLEANWSLQTVREPNPFAVGSEPEPLNAAIEAIGHDSPRSKLAVSRCGACDRSSLWAYEKLVYPETTNSPPVNEDLPDEIKKIYIEAASVAEKSPRSAAALLRLSIQLLCKHLGEPGKKINDDIASLVKKGLPADVQKALDIVRVVGNNAVHPGKISTDSPEIVQSLFELINIIAERMLTEPRKISEMYNSLPDRNRDQIAKRDCSQSPT